MNNLKKEEIEQIILEFKNSIQEETKKGIKEIEEIFNNSTK